MLSLRDAAVRVNKGKSTLQRAIKKGKLTAARDEGGRYKIDPSELARVYPEAFIEKSASAFHGSEPKRPVSVKRAASEHDETPLLHLEIQELRARLQTVEAMSTREIDMAQGTIEDLRKRLDDAATEKRSLTLMLEHHTTQQTKVDGTKTMWQKLFA